MTELVRFSQRHKKDIIRILNNENVAKWLLAPPYPYTEKDADEFLEIRNKSIQNGTENVFAIEKDGDFIGGIGIRTAENGFTQTGYYIDEIHWNKGLGTEALKGILKYGFEILNIKEIHALIFEGNIASEKILLKCGFKFEKNSESVIRMGIDYKTKFYVLTDSIHNKINSNK